MSTQQKLLLTIVEQGGYPDFTPLYESLGYTVISAPSMRKALVLLKQYQPDVITAEFIYSPMYSARISNLESLFAALQSRQLNSSLIIFIDKDELHHLHRLVMPHNSLDSLTYPITEEKLLNCISSNVTIALDPAPL